MLVYDARILQVTLFGTLQRNLSALDFSLLLPDVTTIADEVDWSIHSVRAAKYTVDGGARGMREVFRSASWPPRLWA